MTAPWHVQRYVPVIPLGNYTYDHSEVVARC